MAELGKLRWPYPVEHCASTTCDTLFVEGVPAYCHTDRESGKLVVFCESCHVHVGLHNSLRFPVVAL